MLTFAKVVRRLRQTLSDWTLLTSWNNQRFVAAGDEKLTAFLELKVDPAARSLSRKVWSIVKRLAILGHFCRQTTEEKL